MRIWPPALFAALLAAAPASAQDGMALEEIRGGLFAHDVYQGFIPTSTDWDLSRVENLKFSAIFASPQIDAFTWIGSPRAEIGGTFSTQGRESILHANLLWQIPLFETPLYLELGFGAAIHDGELTGAAWPRRNMGCRVNFYEAAGIGANLSEDVTLTLRYEHTSNLELCDANDGLSNLGLMLGVKF